jgi:hypothetical protein
MNRDILKKDYSELSTCLQTQFEAINVEDVGEPELEFGLRVADEVRNVVKKRLPPKMMQEAPDYALLAVLGCWYERQREVKRLSELIAHRGTEQAE